MTHHEWMLREPVLIPLYKPVPGNKVEKLERNASACMCRQLFSLLLFGLK